MFASSASGSPYFSNTVASQPGSSTQPPNPFQTAYAQGGDPFFTAYAPGAVGAVPQSPGPGSPASSSYMAHIAGVTNQQADELASSLRRAKEAEAAQVAAPPEVPVRSAAPRGTQLGDRGFLSVERVAPQIVPSAASPRPEAPQPSAPPSELAGLAQEVTTKEMELRVLRQQAETTQRDADRLRTQLRDASLQLTKASGSVNTLSAKVEATAGRIHTVLDASAQQMQEQIVGYRRRLERMKYELAEKDEDIVQLQRLTAAGQEKVSGHKERVAAFQQGRLQEQVQQAGPEKTSAVNTWKDASVARIEAEQANTALARERRAAMEQQDAMDSEISALQDHIRNAEQKCRHHATETARRQQHLDTLLMEDRMVVSVANLGAERAAEQRRNGAAEASLLEQRIAEARSKKAVKSGQAQAYDAVERDTVLAQSHLQALTKFVRLVSNALRGPDGAAGGRALAPDRLDHEVDAWVRGTMQRGLPVPPLDRVGVGEYLLNGQRVQLAISGGGKLCARAPDGGLLPMDDYLRSLEERQRKESLSLTVSQPSLAPPAYGIEAGPKTLPALVSPMSISGIAR